MVGEKNQNSGQKPKLRHVDYFFNKKSTEALTSGFVRNIFDANRFVSKKKVI
jgi:hypothetical protein